LHWLHSTARDTCAADTHTRLYRPTAIGHPRPGLVTGKGIAPELCTGGGSTVRAETPRLGLALPG